MKKIIVVGDFAVDRSIHVCATRLCPEAPVPVVVPQKEVTNSGMAGNVIANLDSLGGGHCDLDVFGPDCESEKLRYIDAATGYIMLRVDRDCIKVEEPPFDPISSFAGINLSQIGAVIISDYAKGFLNQKNIQATAKIAKEAGVPTFLDTKLVLGEWSKDIFCVKINQKEYEYNLNAGVEHPEDYCKYLVVTQASKGTRFFCGRVETLIPTLKVNVSDVCGAGDTMLAALAFKYNIYPDLEEAICFANAAASFAVTKRGVYSVTKEDMKSMGIHY